jgi:hypothetical protein
VKPPRVFISYSHDSPEHRSQVIRLATILRELGIDAHLDAWYEGNRQDWAHWTIGQLDQADFILAIASPAFRDRVDGHGDFAGGRGARFEASILRDVLTKDQPAWTRRILPVVLPGGEVADIPQTLFPYAATHFVIRELTPTGLEGVLRALAGTNISHALPLGTYQTAEIQADPPAAEDELVLLSALRAAQRGSDIRFRDAVINGNHYGDSIVYRPDLYCNEPRGAVEYIVRHRFRRFEAIAGVLDDAREGSQTGHFELFVDGKLRARAAVTLGRPARFRVDVTGVSRLRLVAYRSDTVANALMVGALMTGGKTSNLPELAWGNPTLFS